MNTAIVTGANGFIGAHVVRGLLAAGWTVHALGRSTVSASWTNRLRSALDQAGGSAQSGLICHEADLGDPHIALNKVVPIGRLRSGITLLHLAGDTRFRPTDPEAQRRMNVETPLKLVKEMGSEAAGVLARVVHVSTAYVAGKRTGLIREEELDCGQEFWNAYERSKFEAELALTALCGELSIPLVIVRPSIIVNDRRSGRASTFTHLNAMVEVVNRIQDYYGISDGEVVSEAIRVVADPEACPNLAPVDSIVPPLLQIALSPAAAGKVFHLCHPRPQTNREVMGLICEAFQVKDRLALEFVHEPPRSMSHSEEMIIRSLRVYAPYLNNRSEFDLSNSRALVPEYDAFFTPMDVGYLRKVIAFEREQREHVRT